ncbi:MAG: hypothetical protein ACLPXB_15050 [Thiobacillaceae bacterium]
MKIVQRNDVTIELNENEAGEDVVLFIQGDLHVNLTPGQARLVATKLVMASSRAEVRNKLKGNTSISPTYEAVAANSLQG